MKKTLLFFLVIISFACSKDSDDNVFNNTVNPGLLKTIIKYNYDYYGNPEIYSKKNIFYKNGNKIDYVSVEIFSQNNISSIAKIYYHYTGNLITSKERFVGDNPTSQADDYFEYDNQNRVIKYKRYHNLPYNEYTYEYLTNGNIIETYYTMQGVDFTPYSSENLTFDTNNNLASRFQRNMVYDNNFSPTYGIIGLEKIYFIDQLSDDDFYPNYYNNIIQINGTTNGQAFQSNFEFVYNNSNKPIKRINSDNGRLLDEYLYY